MLTEAWAGTGGIQQVNRMLVRALNPDGNAVKSLTLFCANESEEDIPAETRESAEVFTFNRSRLRFLAAALAHRGRFDVLVCAHIALAAAARLNRTCTTRLVFALYGIEAWQRLNLRNRWGLQAADRLLGISRHTIHSFLQANPALASKPVCRWPLGIEKPPSLPPVQKNDRMILCVGRMSIAERYKGHDELLKAMPRVLERIPDAQLVLIGDGDDCPRLQAAAAELGLKDAVAFRGRVDAEALAAAYSQSALFAMPSRGEGFGLVFVEAMAYGLPCVAGDRDGARDVVLHEQTGFTVDPHDVEALADAIISLLEDPDLRRLYGEAGRQRYKSRFTFEAFKQRTLETLGIADDQRRRATAQSGKKVSEKPTRRQSRQR
jgi:glycosyltransferase involved in cell wall biosynthesis